MVSGNPPQKSRNLLGPGKVAEIQTSATLFFQIFLEDCGVVAFRIPVTEKEGDGSFLPFQISELSK